MLAVTARLFLRHTPPLDRDSCQIGRLIGAGSDGSVLVPEQPDARRLDPRRLGRETARRAGLFTDLQFDIAKLVIPATAVAALLHPLLAAFGLALFLGTAQLAFDVWIARPGERIVSGCGWLTGSGLRRGRGRLRVGN